MPYVITTKKEQTEEQAIRLTKIEHSNPSELIERIKVNKKMPNNVVSKVEGDEEEANPNEFQDSVLSCLGDLQRLAVAMREKADMMEHNIRRFRTSIHGEDIDA